MSPKLKLLSPKTCKVDTIDVSRLLCPECGQVVLGSRYAWADKQFWHVYCFNKIRFEMAVEDWCYKFCSMIWTVICSACIIFFLCLFAPLIIVGVIGLIACFAAAGWNWGEKW